MKNIIDANKIINDLRQQDRLGRTERDREDREYERKHRLELEKAWKLLDKVLVPASKSDYEAWLKGFIEAGGTPTHTYDYNIHLRDWYAAIIDFEICPMYGANSINIIAREGVKFLGGERGHCNIYLMDKFVSYGHFIPVYKDIRF